MFAIGDVNYRTLNGIPNQVTYYTTPYATPLYLKPFGVFVQDQLKLKRLTLNGGAALRPVPELVQRHPHRAGPVAAGRPRLSRRRGPELEGHLSPRVAGRTTCFGNGQDGGQVLAEPVRPPGGQGQHQQRAPGDCRHQQRQPHLDGSQRRLHRAGRSAEPAANERARPVTQQQLRQAEHDAALRSGLGQRLRRAALQLGDAAHAAARARPPRRPGGHLQPPRRTATSSSTTTRSCARRLRSVSASTRRRRASARRRRPADLRPLRPESREGGPGGHAPNVLGEVRRSARALERPGRHDAGAIPERRHAAGRCQPRQTDDRQLRRRRQGRQPRHRTCATGNRRSCHR